MAKWTWLLVLMAHGSVCAQKSVSWTASLSQDSVGVGQSVQVSFTLENGKGQRFSPPAFDGFRAVGPSTSSSMQMINGDVTQKITYTYHLEPLSEGVYTIEAARIEHNGTALETEPLTLTVVTEPVRKATPPRRSSEWDMNDFFRDPFARPQPPKREEKREEKSKKPYTTERI